jgi:hypothetical protein
MKRMASIQSIRGNQWKIFTEVPIAFIFVYIKGMLLIE